MGPRRAGCCRAGRGWWAGSGKGRARAPARLAVAAASCSASRTCSWARYAHAALNLQFEAQGTSLCLFDICPGSVEDVSSKSLL